MMHTESIRTVIGIIGNVISFFLFLSPVPTFVNICKAKSVQSFKPDPYLATILNCVMWVWYGMPFVHPDSTLVITINGIGFFIELSYISIFFIFSDWPKRRKMLFVLLGEAIFMAVVVVVTLVAVPKIDVRTIFVGALCVVFNVGMYTSPLTIMKRVIKTKSVKFMPFYLSVANFANGVIWTVYALLKFDPWLFVPNLLGALSGVVQLILYATYYKSTQWGDESNNAAGGDRKDSSNNGVELQSPQV